MYEMAPANRLMVIITDVEIRIALHSYCYHRTMLFCFSELIAYLANLSISQGTFPPKFKLASVTPLLKKSGLDPTVSANFRPISNLNNISKILKRLFLT